MRCKAKRANAPQETADAFRARLAGMLAQYELRVPLMLAKLACGMNRLDEKDVGGPKGWKKRVAALVVAVMDGHMENQ